MNPKDRTPYGDCTQEKVIAQWQLDDASDESASLLLYLVCSMYSTVIGEHMKYIFETSSKKTIHRFSNMGLRRRFYAYWSNTPNFSIRKKWFRPIIRKVSVEKLIMNTHLALRISYRVKCAWAITHFACINITNIIDTLKFGLK